MALEMPDATRTRTRPRAPSEEEDAADIDGIRQRAPEFASALSTLYINRPAQSKRGSAEVEEGRRSEGLRSYA